MVQEIKEDDFFESTPETKPVVPKEAKEIGSTGTVKKSKVKPILKNTLGKEVEEEDYFFGGEAPVWFNKVCGMPVDREDLLEVFNKAFNPKDNFLFYKTVNKEVYVIIVPLKYSSNVSPDNDSMKGDFQKHAISFINEGSVNIDTLKTKLKKILPFVDFKDR
jgi:hypothetical protein